MRRREFISLLFGTVCALPLRVRAQQPSTPMRHIGVLFPLRENDQRAQVAMTTLREGLQELGWTEGHNVQFDIRLPGGGTPELTKAASELLALRPDLVIVSSAAALAPILQITRTVPIVFTNVGDPVGAGFVETLARPGGNATGFGNIEYRLIGKWVEFIKQIAPGLKRAVVLRDLSMATGIGQYAIIQSLAPSFGLELMPVGVRDIGEIEGAISSAARSGESALIVTGSAWAFDHRQSLVELAAKYKLPAIYFAREFTAAGGLMSYAPDFNWGPKRAAAYVDRIFKGEKPADLPVQMPTEQKLVINLKAAKVLGLIVPSSLLSIADELIE
jgi:putative ABC transport system substrate-binding protein